MRDCENTRWASYQIHEKKFLDRIIHLFSGASSVIDVGCGEGRIWATGFFPNFFQDITAIDTEITKAWQDSKEVNWICCDAEHLPLRDECFDVVFAKEMLQYVGPLRTLQEMIRISKKRIIIISPNPNNIIYRLRRHIGALRLTDTLSYLKLENFERLLSSVASKYMISVDTLEVHYYPCWIVRTALDVLGHIMKLQMLRKWNSHYIVVVDKN